MNTKITMGNDEFILYIRKKETKCSIQNDRLGRMIWLKIKEFDINAEQDDEIDCLWGKDGNHIKELELPKTATQFIFDRKILPELYDYLDTL